MDQEGIPYQFSKMPFMEVLCPNNQSARVEGIMAALAGQSDSPPYLDDDRSKQWLEGYDSVVITEES